ncbi:unnamed protein product (macronuclear) [Paramecium tetraurelia]|uniref:Uncharacterized protein n=1 Tax=Paramecium tetraurelia TaxID=5888 RepID=A0E066_PARTE|nr:uncharacterized protein GSPATT00021851001 [Paramecium tetraurelia]CAK88683.1 unnamed protein product [Paramecium tetraurelia]|eukprot:XP_001456080.1 hypothetical protein (macronuclear) [Paramecium tetraurelia strain d4-2]
MFQLNNNEKQIDFRKYQMEPIDQIYLSFSPNQEEQNTLNLKTEEMSIPNIQSFFTDRTNIFDQKVGYFQGSVHNTDQFDFYLISKSELTKLLKQLDSLQKIKQNFDALNQQIQSISKHSSKQSQQHSQNNLQKSGTTQQGSDQKARNLQQSQIMNEGQPHKDVISVRALVGHRDNSILNNNNKENNQALINNQRTTSQQKQQNQQQNYSSVRKFNQPLPSRQRSQTHIHMKYIN